MGASSGGTKKKKVAILTSGGDAPGMNAAIRSFTRSAIYEGYHVYGIRHGYSGLLENDLFTLNSRDVGMIINTGGTILHTSRSAEFETEAGLKKAAGILHEKKIDALCVIGGDGSFRGLMELIQHFDGQVVGIPGTIDNDIPGTEYTIGFDTAVGTAVWAVDKIRDTASSHERVFLIEVMGRHSGEIAVNVALACGAEEVVIPEVKTNVKEIADRLENGRKKGKQFSIVVVAEGDETGGALPLAAEISTHYPEMKLRVTVLGHIQRGGPPSAFDRIWASRMGEAAVRFIKNGHSNVFTAMRGGHLLPAYLSQATEGKRSVDPEMLKLIHITGE